MRRAWVVLVAFIVLWPAIPAGATPTPEFDATTAIALTADQPVTAAIVNDTATAYQLTAASATVFGGPALAVATATTVADSFVAFAGPVPLAAGGVVRLQLAAAGSGSASTGFLTVTLTAGRTVLHLHRAVSFTPTSAVPATTSVTQLSRAGLLNPDGSGDVTLQVPLSSGVCSAAGTPAVTLVDHDRVATGAARCSSATAGTVDVRVHVPGPGTYKGSISLGGKDIAVEIDRGLGPVWPIVAILIGLALAIVVQALTEADWIRQQRNWLRRQVVEAKTASDEFMSRSGAGASWTQYVLELYVTEQKSALEQRITAVVHSRGAWVRRWLVPWPTGYQAKERAAILAEIVAIDALIEGWPAAAGDFTAAHELATGADRPVIQHGAGKLLTRVDALLARDGKVNLDLREIRAQIADAAAALQLAVDLNRQQDRLSGLAEVEPGLTLADQALLATAWQQYRVAAEALKQCDNPVDAVGRVAPLVAVAARSIAGLPDPAAVVLRVSEATEDLARSATSAGGPVPFRVLVPLREVGRFVAAQVGLASFWLVLLVNLVAGVWSGLAVLYVNKPWGHPLDFVVAIAWGFAASTVLTPVLGLLRNLGTRSEDAARPAT